MTAAQFLTALLAFSLLMIAGAAVYLLHCWWSERHARPVWPTDGPQTAFRDADDFLGMGR